MTPVEIGPATTPRQRTDLDAAVVDDTTVVFARGELHALNPSAAAIWRACTGHTRVDAIVGDLASRFAMPRDVMTNEVTAAMESLVERGLVDLDGAVELVSKPVLQPVPLCASCGEGPSYERHVVVDLGEAVLSVGVDRELAGPLATVLRDHVVAVLEQPSGRPSYGVVVPDARRRARVREVSRLYRGPDVLARARHPRRVLDALMTVIAHHRADGYLHLDAVAVGDGARVVLVPPPANRVGFERSATRFGLAVADLDRVMIDSRTGEACIGAIGADLDLSALDAVIAARGQVGEEAPSLAWGSYPVAALGVMGPAVPVTAFSELGPLLATDPEPLGPMIAFTSAVPIVSGFTMEELARVLAG